MKVEGLISLVSADSYDATVVRLDAAMRARAIAPILKIDHAAQALAAGLQLPPVLLVLFGNPKVGTQLMVEHATTGIDLPLKILVWADTEGHAHVGYNDPTWIASRHAISATSAATPTMAALLGALARAAAGLAP